MELMNKKWLFMGDAPTWVEKKVVEEHPELDCDILKAGHHGSDTSSSLLFLQAVTPEVAILSCGLNNSYGHPHISVLNRLKNLGIKIRRTDEEGTISYLTLRGFGL
jgi:competence protein ComEC